MKAAARRASAASSAKAGRPTRSVKVLAPIQERRAAITEPQAIEILNEGSRRAAERAEQTMVEVRDAMKMPLTTVKA